MRVAQGVDIPHRPRDGAGGNLENRGAQRRVQITLRARLDLRVAALLDERRQPADLELASDRYQQVRFLKLEDEARLRLDEMRILIASRHRFDRDPIAADLTPDRREILRARDDRELALRRRRLDPKDEPHRNEGDA